MNRAVLFLLPCLPVIRRLEERKRWWHRLSVIVFFKLLLSTLLAVAAFSYLAWAPKVRDCRVVFENFYLFDADGLPKIDRPEGHVVQMPNGTWATFPSSISNEEIHARWERAKRHQIFSATFWAALLSVFATLAVNYALQGAYRALLYVRFDRVRAGARSMQLVKSKATAFGYTHLD
jgi:hypothetical protein